MEIAKEIIKLVRDSSVSVIGKKLDCMNGLYDDCETMEGKEYLRGRIEQLRDDIELILSPPKQPKE